MRGWEDFVKDIMEGNFVIEGIIGDEEVKRELPSEFEAGCRVNSVIKSTVDLKTESPLELKLSFSGKKCKRTMQEDEYKTLAFDCIIT